MDARFSPSVQTTSVERGCYRTDYRIGTRTHDVSSYFSSEVYCQTKASKLDLCSTSSDDSTTYDASFSCGLHPCLCQKMDGIQMNKRTDEEVSRDFEKKRSPSVIARLMGLDRPHTQVVSELKNGNGHFLLKKSSAGLKEFECPRNHSFLLNRRKHQNFKITRGLSDSSKAKHIDQVFQKEKSYSKPDMDFIKQQFLQAKHFSTNEALQKFKEFHDTIDSLDSNRDIFLKFLEEPNSLFSKHFHDLQHSKSFYPTSRINVLESSASNTCENSEIYYKAFEETNVRTQKKKETLHGCANTSIGHGNRSTYDYVDSLFPKSLRSQISGKRETSQPTPIAVLKPNVRLVKSTRTQSCPRSLQIYKHNSRRYWEFHRDLVERGEQQCLSHINSKGCKKKSTTEIARDISAQTKQPLRRHSAEALASRIDIYKSSTYMSKSSLSRKNFDDLSERQIITSSSKPRLFDEDLCALGELLPFHDKETPQTLDQLISKNLSDKIADKENLHGSSSYTSDISTSDDWRDECDSFLPRNEDPNSSALCGSWKPENNHQVGCFNPVDDCNTLKDMLNREQNDWNISVMHMGHSMLRNFTHCDKNSEVVKSCGEENRRPVKDVEVCQEASRNMINLNDIIEPRPVYLQRSIGDFLHLVHKSSNHKKYESDKSLFFNRKEFQQSAQCKDLSVIVLGNAIPEVTSVNFPLFDSPLNITQSESLMVPKIAERLSPVSVLDPHSSPVSVLDPHSEDGKPSPEFLETVRAGLHDLRRQLNLLELETVDSGDEQSDPLMFNDESGRQMLKSLKHGGDRDFLYLLDILTVSGIYASSQNKIFHACYLSDNPVFPDVFDKLEMKYSMANSWSRLDRRLLFDHINSVLAEVLAPCIDLHPWVKMRCMASCGHYRLVNESWRLLVRQQKELSKGRPEDKVLDTRWLYLDDHVDMIGREIEGMLKDDLLNELVSEFMLG